MRFVWRRTPPDSFNHELVWLVVSAAALVGGAVWLRLGLPTLRCPFLAVTGYPCLTCGATRCAIAFLQGNMGTAWSWNPLGLAALVGLALFDLYAALVLLTGWPRFRVIDWTRVEKNAARAIVITFIVVNWAYLLAHRAQF